MNEPFVKSYINFVKRLCLYVSMLMVLVSCRFFTNEGSQLKLHPKRNSIYKYALVKTAATDLLDNGSVPTIYDTLCLNFSMQNISDSGDDITYKVNFTNFRWKQNVNYQRDSLHTIPIHVVMNDSGTVEEVINVDALLHDIESDSATPNYVKGLLLRDYISVNGIKDLFNKIFSTLPVKKVKQQDTWVRNNIMVAKAPVQISNFYVLEHLNKDTATVKIQSVISARQSPGDITFLKGNRNGYSILSRSSGLPIRYETQSEITTTTKYYDVKDSEHFVVRLIHQ